MVFWLLTDLACSPIFHNNGWGFLETVVNHFLLECTHGQSCGDFLMVLAIIFYFLSNKINVFHKFSFNEDLKLCYALRFFLKTISSVSYLQVFQESINFHSSHLSHEAHIKNEKKVSKSIKVIYPGLTHHLQSSSPSQRFHQKLMLVKCNTASCF